MKPATRLQLRSAHLLAALAWACAVQAAPAADPATGIRWQPLPGAGFRIALTETTVGQFRRYAEATGARTLAERSGGEVFETGWVRRPGWHWRTPFGNGSPAADDEPAVHIGFDEAQAFCRWAGGRLPTDAEWLAAAYTEQRAQPPAGFERGRSYRTPLGEQPTGAQCLDDCGPAARNRAIDHGARLLRGHGHARVDTTPAGVNGLHDMGGNAWEWVDGPPAAPTDTEQRMRGGSWWYGQAQMQAGFAQAKPRNTAAVYIGFRCAKPGL